MQIMEKPLKLFTPKSPKIQHKAVPIPSFAVPQMKQRGDASSRKTIQNVSREIPVYPDPVYQSPPKPVKTPMAEITGSLSDIDLDWILILKKIHHFKRA